MDVQLSSLNVVLQRLQKTLECTICLDLLSNPLTTKCGHSFCGACLSRVLEGSRGSVPCPLCLTLNTKRSLSRNEKIIGLVSCVRRIIDGIKDDCGIGNSPNGKAKKVAEDFNKNEYCPLNKDEPFLKDESVRRGTRKREPVVPFSTELPVPKKRSAQNQTAHEGNSVDEVKKAQPNCTARKAFELLEIGNSSGAQAVSRAIVDEKAPIDRLKNEFLPRSIGNQPKINTSEIMKLPLAKKSKITCVNKVSEWLNQSHEANVNISGNKNPDQSFSGFVGESSRKVTEALNENITTSKRKLSGKIVNKSVKRGALGLKRGQTSKLLQNTECNAMDDMLSESEDFITNPEANKLVSSNLTSNVIPLTETKSEDIFNTDLNLKEVSPTVAPKVTQKSKGANVAKWLNQSHNISLEMPDHSHINASKTNHSSVMQEENKKNMNATISDVFYGNKSLCEQEQSCSQISTVIFSPTKVKLPVKTEVQSAIIKATQDSLETEKENKFLGKRGGSSKRGGKATPRSKINLLSKQIMSALQENDCNAIVGEKDCFADLSGKNIDCVKEKSVMPPPSVSPAKGKYHSGNPNKSLQRNEIKIKIASKMKCQLLDSTKTTVTVGRKSLKSPGWSNIKKAGRDLRSKHTSLLIKGGAEVPLSESKSGSSFMDILPTQESEIVIDDKTQGSTYKTKPLEKNSVVKRMTESSKPRISFTFGKNKSHMKKIENRKNLPKQLKTSVSASNNSNTKLSKLDNTIQNEPCAENVHTLPATNSFSVNEIGRENIELPMIPSKCLDSSVIKEISSELKKELSEDLKNIPVKFSSVGPLANCRNTTENGDVPCYHSIPCELFQVFKKFSDFFTKYCSLDPKIITPEKSDETANEKSSETVTDLKAEIQGESPKVAKSKMNVEQKEELVSTEEPKNKDFIKEEHTNELFDTEVMDFQESQESSSLLPDLTSNANFLQNSTNLRSDDRNNNIDSEDNEAPLKGIFRERSTSSKHLANKSSSKSDDYCSDICNISRRRKTNMNFKRKRATDLSTSKKKYKRIQSCDTSDSNSEAASPPKREFDIPIVKASPSPEKDEKPSIDSDDLRDFKRYDENIWEYFGKGETRPKTTNASDNEDAEDDQPVEQIDLLSSEEEEIPGTAEAMKFVQEDLSLIRRGRKAAAKNDTKSALLEFASQSSISSVSSVKPLTASTLNLFKKCNDSLHKAENILGKRNNEKLKCFKLFPEADEHLPKPDEPSHKFEENTEDFDNMSHSSAFSSQSGIVTTQKKKEVEKEVTTLKSQINALEKELKEDKDETESEDWDDDCGPAQLESSQEVPLTDSNVVKVNEEFSDHESEELFGTLRNPRSNLDADNSSLKTTERRKSLESIVAVCTGLTGPKVDRVGEFITFFCSHKGRLEGAWNASVTHVIVPTDSEGLTERTLKYLYGVAHGLWIVSFDWVTESMKSRTLLPEEDFEALDCTSAPGPRRARVLSTPIFHNCQFCLMPPFTDLTQQQLKDLVRSCGAETVQDPSEFDPENGILKLILVNMDVVNSNEVKGWLRHYGIITIAHDWIIECIGVCERIPLPPYILCQPEARHLKVSGIPEELMQESQDI